MSRANVDTVRRFGECWERSDWDAALVVELRDGRIVRVQGYMDRAAALAAAGV